MSKLNKLGKEGHISAYFFKWQVLDNPVEFNVFRALLYILITRRDFSPYLFFLVRYKDIKQYLSYIGLDLSYEQIKYRLKILTNKGIIERSYYYYWDKGSKTPRKATIYRIRFFPNR